MLGDDLLNVGELILGVALEFLVVVFVLDHLGEGGIDEKGAFGGGRGDWARRETVGFVVDAVEVEPKRRGRIGDLREAHGTNGFAYFDLEHAVHGELVRSEDDVDGDVARERLVHGLVDRLAFEKRLVVRRRDVRYAVDGLGRFHRLYGVIVFRHHFAVPVPG